MLYILLIFSLALVVVGGSWLGYMIWRDGYYWKSRFKYLRENWAEAKAPFIIWAVGTVLLIICLVCKKFGYGNLG